MPDIRSLSHAAIQHIKGDWIQQSRSLYFSDVFKVCPEVLQQNSIKRSSK